MRELRCTIWIVLMLISRTGECQSTVFSVMQDRRKLADKNFQEGNYLDAIALYKDVLERHDGDPSVRLKLAQSYYRAKQYRDCARQYDTYLGDGGILSLPDQYLYAESQVVLKNYLLATDHYRQILKAEPDDDLVAGKIWRLDNMKYLYEDSAHYVVRPLNVNSTSGELCAVPHADGLVFTSNRRQVKAVQVINTRLNAPFYQLYHSLWKKDSTMQWRYLLTKPVEFAPGIRSKFNTGPLAFYRNGRNVVFIASSDKSEAGGNSTLGVFFATKDNGTWEIVSGFPYNSTSYSINDVTINEEGTVMYFSSDMPGGLGLDDIYMSEWKDNRWSKPVNVGEPVNTSGHDVFPFLHRDGILYFSSDGQPGMGQLDIFKSQVSAHGYGEPQNVGYPLNSSYDDFGFYLDSAAAHGFFSSNRKAGGYDDDIYEFDMDLQKYPLTITGVIKFREYSWTAEMESRPWANVKIILSDAWQSRTVLETMTDKAGNFSIAVPYFSRYFIQVADESGNEYKVSLELDRRRRETGSHEIVVVKDIFSQHGQQKH